MRFADYVTAWGLPNVFGEVDRLANVRTHDCRLGSTLVGRSGKIRKFDVFWEFSDLDKTHMRRMAFEVLPSASVEMDRLSLFSHAVAEDFGKTIPVVLTPRDAGIFRLHGLINPPCPVVIMPGLESLQVRADGGLFIPSVRTFIRTTLPGEVITFEYVAGGEHHDGRRLLTDFGRHDFGSLRIEDKHDGRSVPFLSYLNRQRKLMGGRSSSGLPFLIHSDFDGSANLVTGNIRIRIDSIDVVYRPMRTFSVAQDVSPVALEFAKLAVRHCA